MAIVKPARVKARPVTATVRAAFERSRRRASELLPESHHQHPRAWTSIATLLGLALIYGAVRLAGAFG